MADFYQTTRRYNPEDSHLRTHRRENLKSYLQLNFNFAHHTDLFHPPLKLRKARLFVHLSIEYVCMSQYSHDTTPSPLFLTSGTEKIACSYT
jgi:hypothetical protein